MTRLLAALGLIALLVVCPAPARADGVISGMVMDTVSHGHVNGVTITLKATSHSTATNLHGHYSLRVPDGTYTVVPSKQGWEFEPAEAIVVVTAGGGAVHADFQGTLVDAPPLPLPNPPAGLRASKIAKTSCTLAYQDQSSNEDGFVVEIGTPNPGGTTVTWTLHSTARRNKRSVKINRLQRQTTYYFRVRASNQYGHSGPSNEIAVTTKR